MIPQDFDHCPCCGYLLPDGEEGPLCLACVCLEREGCAGCRLRVARFVEESGLRERLARRRCILNFDPLPEVKDAA